MAALVNIGIGSNLGDPAANVKEAILNLAILGAVLKTSNLYLTKAWGVKQQADFCNAAARLETNLPPAGLLRALKQIETEMGRTETFRWGPRLIDLDILTYGDLHIADETLIIPHPHMSERAFVMVPLAEIDERFASARDELLSTLPVEELPLIWPD